ncbi:MAG: polysaccharide biosynthesis/export family protein [Lentisphaeria bacterium]
MDLKIFLFVVFSFSLTGCMDWQRITYDYDNFNKIEKHENAIVEIKKITPEEKEAHLKYLLELSDDKNYQYTIGAGDVLQVNVYNHADMSSQMTVTPDGYIGIMFAGQVKVSDLNLKDASQKVQEALKVYIKNPVVAILPAAIHSITVTVVGGIRESGIYDVSSGMRISDIYAKAGGPATRLFDGKVLEITDLPNSIFFRDGKPLQIDFSAAINRCDPLNNIKLRKNDYLFFATRTDKIIGVIGQVNNPQQALWNPSLGVLELIAKCGGLKETYWKYALIIRGDINDPILCKLDLDGILQGRCQNVHLKAGDVLYIPRDGLSEGNVFIRKLLPLGQLFNLISMPLTWNNNN